MSQVTVTVATHQQVQRLWGLNLSGRLLLALIALALIVVFVARRARRS